MPHYTKKPKDLIPISKEQFIKGMNEGKFVKRRHKGLASLLYHTGVRISEVLRAKKEQFTMLNDRIYFDVGPRLKHGYHTAPLPIYYRKLFVDEILFCVEHTKDDKRVWPYCRTTGYLIISRAFDTYPHRFRMTKITDLFQLGYPISSVRSWTGHKKIGSLDFYVGLVNIEEMGKA